MSDKEKELQQETASPQEEMFEEPETAETGEPAPEEEPQETLSGEEKLQKELEDLNDRHLRLMAEYDNYRKRSTREKDDIYPAATAAAVQKFLPVLDNLLRAQEFERGTEEFAKGFDMICQSMLDTFKEFGVEEIGEAGETFDPNFHNAVMHIEDENLGENVIAQVLQKGYKIGDRVIRYAMVQTAN